MAAQLRQGGWEEKEAPPSLAALRQAVGSSPGTTLTSGVALYGKEGTSAQLSLSSPDGLAANNVGRRAFVLQVDFKNEALGEEQGLRMYAERRRVNGKASAPLPLSYWLARAK